MAYAIRNRGHHGQLLFELPISARCQRQFLSAMWKSTNGGSSPGSPPAPLAAAKSGGSGLKIVMIVVVCLAALGVGAIAAGYYAVHKVKQAVVAKAESYGVDLKSIPSPIPSSPSRRTKVFKPCEILSKSEASALLGEPIERSAMMDEACLYFGPPGLAEKLATQGTSEMMDQAKAGAQLNGGDVADTVTKMLGADHGEFRTKRDTRRRSPVADLTGRPRRPRTDDCRGRFEEHLRRNRQSEWRRWIRRRHTQPRRPRDSPRPAGAECPERQHGDPHRHWAGAPCERQISGYRARCSSAYLTRTAPRLTPHPGVTL